MFSPFYEAKMLKTIVILVTFLNIFEKFHTFIFKSLRNVQFVHLNKHLSDIFGKTGSSLMCYCQDSWANVSSRSHSEDYPTTWGQSCRFSCFSRCCSGKDLKMGFLFNHLLLSHYSGTWFVKELKLVDGSRAWQMKFWAPFQALTLN